MKKLEVNPKMYTVSYAEGVELYLNTVMKESTEVTYKNRLDVFGEYLKKVDAEVFKDLTMIETVKPINQTLRQLQKDGYKTSTVKGIATTVKGMLFYLIAEEGMNPQLLHVMKMVKVADKHDAKYKELPTKQDVMKLKKHMEANCQTVNQLKLRTIIEILSTSGNRITETLNLKYSDIFEDTQTMKLTVTKTHKKDGSPFIKPLSNKAMQLIKTLSMYKTSDYIFDSAKGEVMNRSSVNKYLRSNCEKAGIEVIGLHQLRKYASSNLLSVGATYAEVKEYILCHGDKSITDIYLKPNLKEAMPKLIQLMDEI